MKVKVSIGRHSKNVSLEFIITAWHDITEVGLERRAGAQIRQLSSPAGMAIYWQGRLLYTPRI